MHMNPPLNAKRILIRKNFVDPATCLDLMQNFDAIRAGARSYQGVVDTSLRDCDYGYLPRSYDWIINDFVSQQMMPYYGLGLEHPISQRALVYRYGAGVGFALHDDEVTEVERQRAAKNGQPILGGDFTIVFYLNAHPSFAGGELCFPSIELQIIPEPGLVVAFPATKAYMHLVKPISYGHRFCIVARTFIL